jgi:type II secretion system GspD-like secretin
MKQRRLTTATLVVVVTTAILAPKISRADDTNAARVIDFEFRNAPVSVAIDWLTRLTGKSVIVPATVTFQFSYRTERKVTREEAIDVLSAVFQTNGLHLAKVNDSYYQLTRESVASPTVEKAHVDVELRGDQFLVNGSPVDRADLSGRLAALMTPETEVWVRHPLPPTRDPAFNEGAELLKVVQGLDANRIYTEYIPAGR